MRCGLSRCSARLWGAGILFLPIKADSFGFWPLVVVTLLIGPMTFLAHQAYEWMVGFSPTHGENILEVLREYFDSKPRLLLAVIYWFTIFPVVLIDGVSIVNTAESFIVNQLHGPELSRWALAPVLASSQLVGVAADHRADRGVDLSGSSLGLRFFHGGWR